MGHPTTRASAAAEARGENCQNSTDLARRRRSAASAGWAEQLMCQEFIDLTGYRGVILPPKIYDKVGGW